MRTRDLFKLSFHNLFLHKTRSFLTSLGIIFGVASVVSMLSISEGARLTSLSQIKALGVDNIILSSKEILTENKADKVASSIEKFGLTDVDLKNIKKMDNIKGICSVKNTRKTILKGTQALNIKLVTSDVSFLKYTTSKIVTGRWLHNIDNENKSMVCVIGKNAKKQIFPLGVTNIIGKTVRVDEANFKIVGVIENQSDLKLGELGSPNGMIYIPKATGKAIFGDKVQRRLGIYSVKILDVQYDVFIIKIKNQEYMDFTNKRINAYITKAHKNTKDWSIFVPYALFKQMESTQNIFTIVMASIASISLIVGGVGIMNIMLANVYERRKEIGIRRALGAKKRDIIIQFLIETIFLTCMGGIFGIFLGMTISQVVTHYADWPVFYSTISIIASFSISGLVGVVFGTYPAWMAAQQNPIDVLRSE